MTKDQIENIDEWELTQFWKDTPEKQSIYRTYYNMRQRCENPRNPGYPSYGGRGVECRFESFHEFLREVGFRPASNLTLDRIDNDGHYEAGNLRWTTRSVQQSNRRKYEFWRKKAAKTVH